MFAGTTINALKNSLKLQCKKIENAGRIKCILLLIPQNIIQTLFKFHKLFT